MICLSFVQGRLSKKIGSKFQYFPINNWQNEMPIARKIGFKHIEWIISDYNNPIFNKIFQNQILQVLKENKISISPIGLDLKATTPEEIALSILSEIVMLENEATGKQMKHLWLK